MELYIHIPFCVKKCAYCDFLSFGSDQDDRRRYALALIQELKYWGQQLDHPQVETVFIGGGTPSWMEPQYLAEIIATAREEFHILPDCEFTMEMNPGTVTQESLGIYLRSGVNRLSIGLQSSIDSELQTLGRIHDYNQFLRSYEKVMDAGFTNINTDLISGLYNQSLDKFATSLEKVERHGMKHISVYSLIIEEGTPFYEKYSVDRLSDEEYEKWEEEDRRIYDYTREILAANGYRQYEISNYAKPGYECLHNLVYWNRGDYIGIGIGAASMIHNIRFSTISSLLDYISLNEKACDRYFEKIFNDVSRLSPNEQMNESIMLGFRKNDGIDLESFDTKFSTSFLEKYKEQVCKWREEGMLKVEGGRVYLTEKGQSISNMIIVDFMD